jgi:hypothetical protein
MVCAPGPSLIVVLLHDGTSIQAGRFLKLHFSHKNNGKNPRPGVSCGDSGIESKNARNVVAETRLLQKGSTFRHRNLIHIFYQSYSKVVMGGWSVRFVGR